MNWLFKTLKSLFNTNIKELEKATMPTKKPGRVKNNPKPKIVIKPKRSKWSEPVWIAEAKRHIGLVELTGKNDNPKLNKWWASYGLEWLFRKPWCGLFVAVCLEKAGIEPVKHLYRAKAWLNFGVSIKEPCYGCLVIFNRKGGGHVGFVTGLALDGRIMVTGGNQSNSVTEAPFDRDRVLGYRVPKGYDIGANDLKVVVAKMKSSTNEA